MKMTKKLLCLMTIFLLSCIDPINFKFEGQTEHLVVESKFTNDPGSNYVRLSYSEPYTYPYNKFEENANVYISSEEGENYPFFHTASGFYYPDASISGTIGHTYTLNIVLSDNRMYQSTPVTLKEPIPIDSIYLTYASIKTIVKGRPEETEMPGYQVLIDYTDPGDEKNFYRWSYKTQFEVLTQPRDYIERDCRGCPRPAPKQCCSQCWVKEREDLLVVNDDRLTNGKKVIRQEVFFIPFEKYLNIKYKLKLYQHAISEDTYQFFENMQLQRESTGGIFDPPPSELKGNMFNVNDENEQVIGIFDASSVSEKDLTIEAINIPYTLPQFIYPDDCREMEESTTDRPEDW